MNRTITTNSNGRRFNNVTNEDDEIRLLESSHQQHQEQQHQEHLNSNDRTASSCCHFNNNTTGTATATDTSAADVIDDLKISICLNNRGITLLEHGMCHEAIICFRTAIEGLQGICQYLAACTSIGSNTTGRPGSKVSGTDATMTSPTTSNTSTVREHVVMTRPKYNLNQGIRMMLDGAIKLCSSSCMTYDACGMGISTSTCCGTEMCINKNDTTDDAESTTTSTNDNDTSTIQYIIIKKICCIHGFNPKLIQQMTDESKPNNDKKNTIVYPICIDDFSFNEIFRDPRMTFAIVLYNIALATKCQEIQLCNKYMNENEKQTQAQKNSLVQLSDHNTSSGASSSKLFKLQQQQSYEQQIRLLTVADNILKKRLLQSSSSSSTTSTSSTTTTSSNHSSRNSTSSNSRINVEKLWLVCSSGIVLASLVQAQSSLSFHQQQYQEEQQLTTAHKSSMSNHKKNSNKRKRQDNDDCGVVNGKKNTVIVESTTNSIVDSTSTSGSTHNNRTNLTASSTATIRSSLNARLTLLQNFIVNYKQVCSCGGTEDHFPAAAA